MTREPAARLEGTDEGFRAFFEREHRKLLQALVVLTRSAHAAEELAQEAMVKVWERWPRISQLENPTGYLFRCAMNAHFQTYRRARRAALRMLGHQVNDDPIARVEDRDELQRGLLLLPERQRAALIVTEFLGYDSAAAGEILGVRPGTVRRLSGLARERLRQHGDAWRGEEP